MGLYDYLDGFGFLVPRVPIHAFAQHIRHAYEVGFTDYFGESRLNWGLDGPLPWTIAQLLQNPEQNVDGLLNIYYREYFQGAADSMRQFFARCEDQWMRQPGPSYWLKHYRNPSQAALFPSSVCAELRRLLNRAAVQANSDIVRQRVAFVSDAFGVTERFVALCESRDALTTAVLARRLSGAGGEALLADYQQKRVEFIRYTHRLAERCPLAFSPINYDDWLRDDPTFAARIALATANRPANELLPNGVLAGPIVPGRRIAGLQFALDLPAPWQSRMEPTQHATAELMPVEPVEPSHRRTNPIPPFSRASVLATTDPRPSSSSLGTARPAEDDRLLRLQGQESAVVFTWVPALPGRTYVASLSTRAELSPSDTVELVFGWLDAHQKRIGKPIGIRLPEGSWPDWVQLVQGAKAPSNAAWVGIQLIVQHQTAHDWAEVRDFSLREIEK